MLAISSSSIGPELPKIYNIKKHDKILVHEPKPKT